jgi:riboflavin biosynthesis pyrimidine reductase
MPLTADDLLPHYQIETGQPWVRMMFIASLDGAVEVHGESRGLGSADDRLLIGVLRGLADGILVGAGTLRADNYRAIRPRAERRAWRTSVGLAEYPRLVVVSGGLNLDPAHPALAEAPVRPVIITHGSADDERRDALETVADVLVCGVDRVDLRAGLAELRSAYRLDHLLCEGGPSLFGALHAAGLVDEVCLTIAPLLAGAGAGRIIAGPTGPLTKMSLAHAITADDYLLLRYIRAA